MTKSELRQLICEVLHEELASKKYLKEAQGAFKGTEDTTMYKTQYQLQLLAWDKSNYRYSYSDSDGSIYGDVYEYIGDLSSIINKLNTIAEKYEFSFINIYINGTDECVFDAGTVDSTAEEDEFGILPEVAENTVFLNKIIPESAPFMKQFKIGSKSNAISSVISESKKLTGKHSNSTEEFRLYETMWEELSKQCLNETTTDTVIITAHSFDEKIRVAKKDLALAKKLDRKACDIWESAEKRYHDEDELCARLGIMDFSGVEVFSKLADDAGLEFEVVED